MPTDVKASDSITIEMAMAHAAWLCEIADIPTLSLAPPLSRGEQRQVILADRVREFEAANAGLRERVTAMEGQTCDCLLPDARKPLRGLDREGDTMTTVKIIVMADEGARDPRCDEGRTGP